MSSQPPLPSLVPVLGASPTIPVIENGSPQPCGCEAMTIRGIIWHWDAGDNDSPDRLSRRHYHWTFDRSGREDEGDHTPADNLDLRDGRYAAHTRRANRGRIGLAVLGMHGARENVSPGTEPITVEAVDAMLRKTAALCLHHGLSVSRTTTLSHAEVEDALGIAQRGKWDITWLPYPGFGRDGFASARECGDFMRERVRHFMAEPAPEPVPTWRPAPEQAAHFTRVAPPFMHRIRHDLAVSRLEVAAIFGNFAHETEGLTDLSEDRPARRTGGVGWAQWSHTRRVDFLDFCEGAELDPMAHEASYRFAVHELTNTWEHRALAAMDAVPTLAEKVVAFERAYERAGVKHDERRIAWGHVALAAFDAAADGNATAPSPPVAVPAPNVEALVDAAVDLALRRMRKPATEGSPCGDPPASLPEVLAREGLPTRDAVRDALKEAGSRTIARSRAVLRRGLFKRAWAILSGGSLASLPWLADLRTFLGVLPWWAWCVLGLAVAGAAWHLFRRDEEDAAAVIDARVDDALSGANTARLEEAVRARARAGRPCRSGGGETVRRLAWLAPGVVR